jgi:tetratricopeptide (TPR) repeat protein
LIYIGLIDEDEMILWRKENKDDSQNEIARLNQQASQLQEQIRYGDAINIATPLGYIVKQTFSEEHSYYADSLSYLASLYSNIGDYTKAEPLHQQSIEVYRKALGENHPNCATSLNSIAALYSNMGDYTKAEPVYKKALEIRHNVLGENNRIMLLA